MLKQKFWLSKNFFSIFKKIMQVNSVNSYSILYQPSFGINLNSKKLRFKEDDFYVRIKGYGHHSGWAKKVRETADNAVYFIRNELNFESLLRFITEGVRLANQLSDDTAKQVHTGILRSKRKYWRHGSDWKTDSLITHYDGIKSKYKTYKDKLDRTVSYPLRNPYEKFMLTRPMHSSSIGKYLNHADGRYVNRSLDMVNEIYDNLHKKYIEKEATKADLEDINSQIAEIRWILAHATPWERGSDAISNTFIRSIYKAMGIKTSPLKKGISLDLEAYCTNLKDYQTKFETYFVKKPYIVE